MAQAEPRPPHVLANFAKYLPLVEEAMNIGTVFTEPVDRMKEYERRFCPRLMPLLPIVVRIDGKAFHNFTRHGCWTRNRTRTCVRSARCLMTQYRVDPKEKNLLKALRCPKHPRYKGLRRPSRRHPCDPPCRICVSIYRLRHPCS
jgi:hypothetical protein